jgi:3-(3-hydroxy-phenyl)propionate hydroxylase
VEIEKAEALDTDVLIVGCGPVGAALACALGNYGVRTVVIDKAADILPLPRAISLDSDALRILQRVGLEPSAFDTVVIPHVRLVSPRFGEFARVDTSGPCDGHPQLVTFHQPDLERALRARAAQHPSVTLRCATELLSLSEVATGVHATVRSVDGVTQEIKARYAVGSDGAASLVRGVIGETFAGRTYQEWLVVDARDVPEPIDHVEFICDHRRPTPHMVAPGGRQRWEFMLQPGELKTEMEREEVVRKLVAPWSGGHPITIDRRAVYRFHARVCKRFQKGRIFLAGDAAHVTPPFVGQGLVAGLRDVGNLGWKLAWVVKGLADARILDSYDQERRPHARQMIDLARGMGYLVAPPGLLASLWVQAALWVASALPLTRRLIARATATKPSTRFRSGMFVAGKAGLRLRRGAWVRQGLLRAPDGARKLSDDVLGAGLTCVSFGRAAEPYVGKNIADEWRARGGSMVQLLPPGAPHAAVGEPAYEALDQTFSPLFRDNWVAVFRPDGVLLHDGPLRAASRVLQESLSLLDSRAARS